MTKILQDHIQAFHDMSRRISHCETLTARRSLFLWFWDLCGAHLAIFSSHYKPKDALRMSTLPRAGPRKAGKDGVRRSRSGFEGQVWLLCEAKLCFRRFGPPKEVENDKKRGI